MLAEAIGEERVEIDLLLAHEAGRGKLPVEVHVHRGTHRGSRRDLDGTPNFIAMLLVIDLASIPKLDHLAVALTGRRAEDDDHIL